MTKPIDIAALRTIHDPVISTCSDDCEHLECGQSVEIERRAYCALEVLPAVLNALEQLRMAHLAADLVDARAHARGLSDFNEAKKKALAVLEAELQSERNELALLRPMHDAAVAERDEANAELDKCTAIAAEYACPVSNEPHDAIRKMGHRIDELKEALAFIRDGWGPFGAQACPACVYVDGVFQRPCKLHEWADARDAAATVDAEESIMLIWFSPKRST